MQIGGEALYVDVNFALNTKNSILSEAIATPVDSVESVSYTHLTLPTIYSV